VLALAASVLLLVRAGNDGAYVATKGTPAVQLLVHRDEEPSGTRVWDGRSPVQPGDRLALHVACEGRKRVTVAAPGKAGWQRLSEVPCPESGDPLPFTLVVDDEPGDEQLAVVLSEAGLDDAAMAEAIGHTERTGETWVVKLVLPKTGPRR
jgi:hypothetical protein